MKVTAFLATLVLGILSVPLASEAQLPRTIPRIAFLALASGPWAVGSEALAQGLRELGYGEQAPPPAIARAIALAQGLRELGYVVGKGHHH